MNDTVNERHPLRKTNVYPTFLATVLCLLLAGCGGTRKVTPVLDDKPVPPAAAGLDESFDPGQLNDHDLSFPDKARPVLQEDSGSQPVAGTAVSHSQNQEMDGFRIQLFASKDIERVTIERKEAEFVFLEDDVVVYIEFDSPMYKLRIGDCQTREEADQLRQLAKQKGYAAAWIVKTRVNSLPVLPGTENDNP